MPSGEAPEDVRKAWIGVILPVLGNGPGNFPTFGVLSGPKSRFAAFLANLFGRTKPEYGYIVDASEAVCLLSAQSVSAAEWWRTNAPNAVRPGAYFVFDAGACEEVRP